MHSLALASFLVAAVWTGTAQAEPDASRQDELLHLLRHDCGSCHGLTMRGGLGPDLLPQRLAALPQEHLITSILEGRPGTPMPPWSPELSPAEAAWLVQRLQRGLDEN